MGVAPFGFESHPLIRTQGERGAIVDRRQPTRLLALALAIQLFRCLVAGVDEAACLQIRERRLVAGNPGRLVLDPVRCDAQPRQIFEDRLDEMRLGTLGVGIVEPEDEGAAQLLRQQRVPQRRAGVADVDIAGGRGSETENGGHCVC